MNPWLLPAPFRSIVLSFALAAGVLFNGTGFAQELRDAQTLFQKANKAYESERYDDARDLYLEVLALAPRNPTAEYNLGNTYARLGDVGRSVLHYERALESDPRMEDARRNLRQVAPPSNFTETSPLVKPFAWLLRQMNVNEWLTATFLFLAGTCGLAAFGILGIARSRMLKLAAAIFAVLFAISALFSLFSALSVSRNAGIVLSDKALARSGPGENYLEAMDLPPGAKVFAAGEPQRGWIKFTTPDGRAAFLPTETIEWI